MTSPRLRTFEEPDRVSVIDLWRRSDLLRSWNDPDRDIDRKMMVNDEMFFVAAAESRVIGTVMAGYDGHRGWINYLAVDVAWRDAGVGRLLMERAEQALRGLGCPKINLQIRTSNVGAAEFYKRLGYEHDDVVSMGKRVAGSSTLPTSIRPTSTC